MASKPVPIVRAQEMEGISQVNGSEMNYGSWYLLNEAFSCFRNHEYYACLSCLSTSTELWLRRELKASSRIKLQKLIRTAEEHGLISKEESMELDKLRETRNSYVHFDMEKLPKVSHVHKIGVYESPFSSDSFAKLSQEQETINPYPTERHKDALPLFALGPTAFFTLNKIVTFFSKRYPNTDGHVNLYSIGIVERIINTAEKEYPISL
ncbi:MAG: hypothetical protein ABSC91_06080 [Candidatus Bathyarchaeia archaeon]